MTAEIHTKIDADELARTFEDEASPPVDLSGHAFEDWIALALFWLMTLCVFLQFFTRYVLNDSYAWTEEIAVYCLIAIVFVGAAMCVRINRHIQVDFLYRYIPAGMARILSTAIDVIRFVFFAYTSVLMLRYMFIVSTDQMTTINYPKNLVYGWAFVGFILMTLRSMQVAYTNWQRGYSTLERPETYDTEKAD